MRSGPKKLPNAPTTWRDVWYWCEDIEHRWGYFVNVTISPPLPSQLKVRFVVQVNGRKLKVGDPQRESTVTKWRCVTQEGLTAETVALQMVVELHQKLDTEEYDAERAALASGAMF